MRSRAPLALIEQALMLVVFALAAVLCLKAFAWADVRSEQSAARDRALLEAQNVSETLKYYKGDFAAAADFGGGAWNGEVWTIRYDGAWNETADAAAYLLRVSPRESGLETLGMADVAVLCGDTPLAALQICWQEVGGDG